MAIGPTVSLFDPTASPPAVRLAVGRLLAAASTADYPEDPPLHPQREADRLNHVTSGERATQFIIWAESEALAWARLEYSLTQNRHAAHARVLVHPAHRRQGLGRRLAQTLGEVARREGRSLVTFSTPDWVPAGAALARELHAEPALHLRWSQLQLAEVSDQLLETWLTRPAGDPYRLHLWERIPEECVERAANLRMVMNTAPRGDLEVQDRQITPEMIRAWEGMTAEAGVVALLLVVEDQRTGRLEGYTEVFWSPERAALVHQGDTAVRTEARGQGLGKWLKATMIGHIRTRCPGARVIRTANAQENAPMLRINTALGFTLWNTTTEWQVRLVGQP